MKPLNILGHDPLRLFNSPNKILTAWETIPGIREEFQSLRDFASACFAAFKYERWANSRPP